MFETYVKQSDRTGNPEIWGYDEQPNACVIIFGSLVTGGLNQQTKSRGYGHTTEVKKQRDYTAAGRFSRADIDEAKRIVQAIVNRNPVTVDSASVANLAMSACGVANIGIPVWLRAAANGRPQQQPTAPDPITQPSPTQARPKAKKLKLEFQKTDMPYSW